MDFEYKYLYINDKEHSTLYVPDRESWRTWLSENHETEQKIWLVYFKKQSGKERVDYNDAVEEAICFGWIDSTVKKIDEERYMQLYTVRNKKSKWSETNKERAIKLIRSGKMSTLGLKSVENAKETGNWENTYGKREKQKLPDDLKSALLQDAGAYENFKNFAPSYQNSYIYYINDAKLEDTRKRRILKVVSMASKNMKPSML